MQRAVADAGRRTEDHRRSRVINLLAAELNKQSHVNALAIMQAIRVSSDHPPQGIDMIGALLAAVESVDADMARSVRQRVGL
jgi:hypothetical protein